MKVDGIGSSQFRTEEGKFSSGLDGAQKGRQMGSTAPGEAGPSEVIGAKDFLASRPLPSGA